MLDTAHRLGQADAVGIIGIAGCNTALGHTCKLSAILPRHRVARAVVVGGRVKVRVIDERRAVIRFQKIAEVAVSVGIGTGIRRRGRNARCKGIGVRLLARDVSAAIVRIDVGLVLDRVILTDQLSELTGTLVITLSKSAS